MKFERSKNPGIRWKTYKMSTGSGSLGNVKQLLHIAIAFILLAGMIVTHDDNNYNSQ